MPDIAGPGVLISAALSLDTDQNLLHILDFDFQQGNRFDAFSGTSMAAPAVAGVIALMLQKNKDLADRRRPDNSHGARQLPGRREPGSG